MNSDIKVALNNAGELARLGFLETVLCVQAKAVSNLDHS